ncbi:MAG: cation:proton antiporter [Bacillota bacterium]|nr:cation:proton antiporter [Bacillota bacterium]HHT91846.1 cation:proton antiporter [Bacillota bacterium]
MDILLKLGVALVVGLVGGKVARIFRLPNVSGYLVAGLFLGPSFFGYVTEADTESLAIISEVALAIIAFSIGSEFIFRDMLKLGKSIMVITLLEVVGAVVVVFALMFFVFGQPFAFSIVIASMSAATAPAATLMVIRQYRAQGPLTRTVLPVVALDDVLGIMAFGIAMSLARLSVGGSGSSLWHMLTQPLIEIVGSLLLGTVLGYLLTFVGKRAADKDELQGVSLAAIAVATGLSNMLGLSPLLTNIMMGTVLVNVMRHSTRVFGSINDFASPVYILFFTLAGASLDLRILMSVGLMGLGYIVARAGGKMLGAYVGARRVGAEDAVRKYLGLTLLPQGGISIGLSVLVRQLLPQYAVPITTIIMFSVLVYEVSGPIFSKIAIQKAGEIGGVDGPGESLKTSAEERAV